MPTPQQGRGTPPWRGRRPGEGKPRDEGVPRETATLPDEGLPPGSGKLPTDGDVILPGSPGQVPKGTPGTLEPWMENPWAPGATDEAWAQAPDPSDEDDEDDDFYRHHPTFHGRPKPDEER